MKPPIALPQLATRNHERACQLKTMTKAYMTEVKKDLPTNDMVEDVEAPAAAASLVRNSSHDKAQDLILDTVNAAAGEYSEADYKRVLRKIDLVLLPLMWLCYGTQQADKTSISTQATFGMRADTGLVGQQFSCKS